MIGSFTAYSSCRSLQFWQEAASISVSSSYLVCYYSNTIWGLFLGQQQHFFYLSWRTSFWLTATTGPQTAGNLLSRLLGLIQMDISTGELWVCFSLQAVMSRKYSRGNTFRFMICAVLHLIQKVSFEQFGNGIVLSPEEGALRLLGGAAALLITALMSLIDRRAWLTMCHTNVHLEEFIRSYWSRTELKYHYEFIIFILLVIQE